MEYISQFIVLFVVDYCSDHGAFPAENLFVPSDVSFPFKETTNMFCKQLHIIILSQVWFCLQEGLTETKLNLVSLEAYPFHFHCN